MIHSILNKVIKDNLPLNQKSELTSQTTNYLGVFGFCFFLAALYLLICSKSSPLYPFNDWVDANAIFTLGKGMMNGKIPYRDLFETKGVLLFFIQGLAYLISNKTFLGVFIFEAISFSIFLLFCYKVICLYVSSKWGIIALPIISTCILNLRSFTHGDSAEEYCLPLFVISLFYLLSYFKNVYPKPASNQWIFWNGVIAGCVLWIKFSMLGFWFGWIVSIILCMIINRNILCAIKSAAYFLAGLLIATIPWIIYFSINGAIPEWINTYIVYNSTLYPTSTSFISGINNLIKQIERHFNFNPLFCGLMFLGLLVFIVTNKYIKCFLNRICLLLCVLLLSFGVYGGGRNFIYYFLIFSPLILFGIIFLLDLYIGDFGDNLGQKLMTIIIIIIIATTFF